MARTRGKGAAAASTSTTGGSTSTASRYTLPAETETPPKLFILPRKATPEARIVTLHNPRYCKPTRYLVCPETGIYEFTRIAAPKSTPRSWLIESAAGTVKGEEGRFDAQVTKDADLYVATLVDPLFLVLPALATRKGSSFKAAAADAPKRMFLTSDDHFDAIAELSSCSHISEILRLGGTRALVESRMATVCDTVDAGDETMFRLNEAKLLEQIVSKARRMSEQGLPKSMEEKFVTKALEAPIVGIRSQAAPATASQEGSAPPEEADTASQGTSLDSQSSFSSATTSTSLASEASTAATSVSGEPTTAAADVVVAAIAASDQVIQLQRLRVAFGFICSSYVAPELATLLKRDLEAQKGPVDLAPLNDYLDKLAKLRQEAAASRSSDYSRKRDRDEEDDERAEKRRKKEEEDKRSKAAESRAVKELKKVNTSGMKKLSEFFRKK